LLKIDEPFQALSEVTATAASRVFIARLFHYLSAMVLNSGCGFRIAAFLFPGT
jgi:hypothetical protein